MTNFTIRDFRKQFGTEKACLDYIFAKKYPKLVGQYYFIKGRKCYANTKGEQIHPVKGTVFEHSSTPLTLWFYAIFLFSASRNGVSAKELQRQLGVTYKCAWRMAAQIRVLMKQGNRKLTGFVEVDETYFGGKGKAGRDNVNLSRVMKAKSVIAGAVERGGIMRAKIAPNGKAKTLGAFLAENVEPLKTKLMTDDSTRYWKIARNYDRKSVNHKRLEYVRGEVHTNTIEGFWGQFKTSLKGTYHSVSKKHLQSYVDEFAFRRNARPAVFEAMVGRI